LAQNLAIASLILIKIEFHERPLSVGSHAKKERGHPIRVLISIVPSYTTEFLTHYHKRSNVETAFSMIKGKFGDAVRSTSDMGQLNEVLCKVLCHHLCVITQLPPKFEVKRCGVSDHSKDSMAVSSGGYSASNFGGSAVCGAGGIQQGDCFPEITLG
jgi:hypothetical protein